MSDQSLLDRVRVASPCNARWEDMNGDERARFCHHCQKHVFNLSALTSSEAKALIREKEGGFCGRFYRRRDGRMLTADCVVGRRRRQWGMVKFGAVLFALVALSGTALLASVGRSTSPRGPFSERVDGWIYDLKVRLGIIQPPVATMGFICVPPPVITTTNPPPTNLNSNN